MEQRARVSVFSIVLVLLAGLLLPLPAGAVVYDDSPTPAPGPAGGQLEAGTAPDVAPNAGPIINVWYNSSQSFGQPGKPQVWVNILGNVSDPDGINWLRYTLNNGPEKTLSVGPDTRRLARQGDFNIDIAYSALQSGLNQVEISAQDGRGEVTTTSLDLQVTQGLSWPLPYDINWSSVGNLQSAVQVVDGRWSVGASGLHIDQFGYDRMVAIGNMTWSNYEVRVPITIHSVDPAGYGFPSYGPGIGFLLRWQGHTDDPISGLQPKSGWQPFGAIGWYRYLNDALGDRLQLLGDNNRTISQDTSGRKLNFGVRYIFKMRVETVQGQGTFYGLKVWQDGQSEPSGWDISGYEPASDLASGSFLLLAHHVEATFGNVSVTPLGDTVNLAVTIQGNGTVQKDPDRSGYYVGEQVRLTPAPASGWAFDGWSGAHASELVDNLDGSWTLTMNAAKAVTANFSPSGSFNVTVATVGQGTVTHLPGNPYAYGQTATLEPLPTAGWNFDAWSGQDAGDLVDNGDGTYALFMDSDKSVTARFTQPSWNVTVAILGEGTVSNTPGNPYAQGKVATLRPIPVAGWTFAGWSGDNAPELVDNEDGTWSLTMDGNKAVTARFLQASYNVAISVLGQGSVLKTPAPPYTYGTQLVLQPVPAAGWKFSGWSGANAGQLVNNGNGTWSLTIDGDKAVTATFKQAAYSLTVTLQGQGTVAKSPPPPPLYEEGTVVTLTPEPATGWRFAGWDGPDASDLVNKGDGTWSLTMNEDKAITAVFSDQYELLLDVTGQGSVTRDPDRATYQYGQQVRLAPVPAAGWRFDAWAGPAAGQLTDNGDGTWSLTMDGHKMLLATFVPGAYLLVIQDTAGNGTVSPPEGNYAHSYGDVVDLIVTPEIGWLFDGWDGPSGSQAVDNGDGTWSLTINGDKSIQARFARQEHSLRIKTTIGTGTTDPGEGTHVYYYGDVATLTAIPAPGWSFVGWRGPNGSQVVENGDGTWSLLMDQDKVLQAEFMVRQLAVQLTYQGMGSVRNLPGNPYTYGEVATLEPLPAPGWIFAGWKGEHAHELQANGDGTWSLMMDGDKVLAATFARSRAFLPLITRQP